jgi:cerevisin
MASPHIAGLLAYFLSLQPAKDSAYAVADITPKELKANLISIATQDALTDVPSNTKNLLAWNGGGSSNFSSIIDKGGYVAKAEKENTYTITIPTVSEIEENVEVEFEKAKQAAGRVEKNLQGKLERLSEEIEDFITEEMEGFFKEFKERVARE